MEEQHLMEQVLDWVRNRYFGVYRGIVTDNGDPTSRGRLRVRVPAVLGELETWAMPCVPYAGQGVGFYSLPEPDTGVWVMFEAGDPSYPVWTGFFWADGELPDPGGAAVKIWKTGKLTLRIDDDADEMLLQTTSESKVILNNQVKAESGGATHTVGSGGVVSELGSGKVEVTTATVKVNNGALEVM